MPHYFRMKKFIPTVALRKEVPAYQQIADSLRHAILEGEMACGLRLPTVQRLAHEYKTSVFTIQTALERLARDGFIKRTRRRGTFVTSRTRKLRNVGVYFGTRCGQGFDSVYQELHRLLGEDLAARGVTHRLWVDGRPADSQSEPLPELIAAAEGGLMQGLVVTATNPAEMNWLSKMGIPLSLFGTAPVPYRVGFRGDLMMRTTMSELRRQGCRSVGAILPISPSFHGALEIKVPDDVRNYFESFVNCAADAGLETRNSWVRIPDRAISASEYEDYGYREFHELWKQKERPDGLLIFPDGVVRGCVIAMLQNGVSTPNDLKLVLCRNQGIPVPCPLTASWLVADIKGVASALISQLERQLAGEPIEPIFVSHTLECSSTLSSTKNPTTKLPPTTKQTRTTKPPATPK
jgi:DNA-binding LacI/PurR family transcriptional regulator